MSTPIALAISDLHLSLLQPVCRADKDWLAVQAGYLKQVKDVAKEQGKIKAAYFDTDEEPFPILCAGDIFDRWNAPPELIHFALQHLPNGMICVPGQHDLPNHRMDQIHRSGYGVLKQAGKIIDISNKPAGTNVTNFAVYGFGWGEQITPPPGGGTLPCIALIHRYCWDTGYSYPGAPEENHVGKFRKQLKGYDVAVFGDNHKGFSCLAGHCEVLNVGGFIRRKSDEIDYRPAVGIIFDDGTVKRKRLHTDRDLFHEGVEDRKEVPLNMAEFIEGLEALGEHGLNFREAVENHLRDEEIDEQTKEIVLRAMEGDNSTK